MLGYGAYRTRGSPYTTQSPLIQAAGSQQQLYMPATNSLLTTAAGGGGSVDRPFNFQPRPTPLYTESESLLNNPGAYMATNNSFDSGRNQQLTPNMYIPDTQGLTFQGSSPAKDNRLSATLAEGGPPGGQGDITVTVNNTSSPGAARLVRQRTTPVSSSRGVQGETHRNLYRVEDYVPIETIQASDQRVPRLNLEQNLFNAAKNR